MKNIVIFLFCFLLVNVGENQLQANTNLSNTDNLTSNSYLLAKASKNKKSKRKKRRSRRRKKAKGRSQLINALSLAKAGKYQSASMKLFQLSHSPRYADKKDQIKYILGLMLYQMQLNQTSAYQFINVIKNGKKSYLKQSLEKLSLAADYLGDDTLLNYAMTKVKVSSFPKKHRNMLFYRLGEFQMRNDQLKSAINSFKRVKSNSNYYAKASYMKGLAYAELKKFKKAISTFDKLINSRSDRAVTDQAYVGAVLAKARVQYHAKKWEDSLETYREIPRDTKYWHNALFESSWTMLRSGLFRSALSNFHSLHSSYYEENYLPESLLLRSITYLYICKYDEMDKVLRLFKSVYKPVYKDIKKYIKSVHKSEEYFNVVAQVSDNPLLQSLKISTKYKLPLIIKKHLFNEGGFQNNISYILKLYEEKNRIKELPLSWKKSALGRYATKVITTRIRKAKQKAGRIVRNRLIFIKEEVFDLFEQQGFIRFEMLKGKKESVKKEIDGNTLADVQVDDDNQRDYYIQNGYEYWPFKGEYWLDELGNYHYLGTQSCE
jgi:TolA-binding protein